MSDAPHIVRWKMPFSELVTAIRQLGLPAPVLQKLRAVFLAGADRGRLNYSEYCPLQYAVEDYSCRLSCSQPAGLDEPLFAQLTCVQCKCVAVLRAAISRPDDKCRPQLDEWLARGLDVSARVSREIDLFLSAPLPDDLMSTACRKVLAPALKKVIEGLWSQRNARDGLDNLDWAQVASAASETMRRRSVLGSFSAARQSGKASGRSLDEGWLTFLLYGVRADIAALLKMSRGDVEQRRAADHRLRQWGFEPGPSPNWRADENEKELPIPDYKRRTRPSKPSNIEEPEWPEWDICTQGCAAYVNGTCAVRQGLEAQDMRLPCFLDWADFWMRLDAKDPNLGDLPREPTLRLPSDVVSEHLGKWLVIMSISRRDKDTMALLSTKGHSARSRYERLMEILGSQSGEK